MTRYATRDQAELAARKMNASRDAGDPAYHVYLIYPHYVIDCREPEARLKATMLRSR